MLRFVSFLLVLVTSLLVPTVHAALTLEQAAERGNVAALREQLGAGADINQRNDTGRSALLIAARHGKLPAVEALVQAGADINLQDKNGDTALHLAAVNTHRPVVEFLLRHGANAKTRNNNHLTALGAVETSLGRYAEDRDLSAMADYLAKTIPTLPQHRAQTIGGVSAPTKTGAATVEDALLADSVTVDVKKYNPALADLQRAAKTALFKRGWTVLKSEPQKFIGSYTRFGNEYRVEILILQNQVVRIAFLNGYQDTSPGYLRNLEKEILNELEFQRAIR